MSLVGLNRSVLQAGLSRLGTRLANEPKELHQQFKPAFSKWGSDWQNGVHSRFVAGNLNSRVSGEDTQRRRIGIKSGHDAF